MRNIARVIESVEGDLGVRSLEKLFERRGDDIDLFCRMGIYCFEYHVNVGQQGGWRVVEYPPASDHVGSMIVLAAYGNGGELKQIIMSSVSMANSRLQKLMWMLWVSLGGVST